jgi:hypothetical protein
VEFWIWEPGNRLYSCILKVFEVDSDGPKIRTLGPCEVIILDRNENKCKDGLLINLRYDWTGASSGRQQYVCCCKVNDNLR